MTWVAVGVAAAGAATSILGGIGGKKAAEEAGLKQANIILKTDEENQKRRRLDLEQQLGGITAAISASNIQQSGSSLRYKSFFESNIRSEMAWDAQNARINARLAKKTGQTVGKSAMYQGASQAIGFAGQAYSAGTS